MAEYFLFSGISYSLIGPVTMIISSARNKKINMLFTEEEINEVTSEVLLIEEKNVLK